MILKAFYHWISGVLFGRTIRYNNIIEAVTFTTMMKRAVLSMNPVGIVHYKIPCETDEYICIDYGLIFSASRPIQRYIVVQGGEKLYLHEDERITLFEN
jgi:hypothetical protein